MDSCVYAFSFRFVLSGSAVSLNANYGAKKKRDCDVWS